MNQLQLLPRAPPQALWGQLREGHPPKPTTPKALLRQAKAAPKLAHEACERLRQQTECVHELQHRQQRRLEGWALRHHRQKLWSPPAPRRLLRGWAAPCLEGRLQQIQKHSLSEAFGKKREAARAGLGAAAARPRQAFGRSSKKRCCQKRQKHHCLGGLEVQALHLWQQKVQLQQARGRPGLHSTP